MENKQTQSEWESVTTNYGTEERPELVRTLEKQRAGKKYRLHIGNTNTWADILDERGKTLSSVYYRQGKDCHVYNPDELLEYSQEFYEAVRTAHAKRNLTLMFSQAEGIARERELRTTYSEKSNMPRYVDENETRLNRLYRRHSGGSDLINTIKTAEEVC